MEYYTYAWIFLSLIGLLVSIELMVEARKDLYALVYSPNKRGRYLEYMARNHLKQELLMIAQMIVATSTGAAALLHVAMYIIVPSLLLILAISITQGILRLLLRRRVIEEEDSK